MTPEVRVQTGSLDPWAELAAYEQAHPELAGQYGGVDVFVGSMRDHNDGREVQAMTLEHYPGMTEKFLERVCREAGERWPVLAALVIHRVGPLQPGEPIVLVAVWTAHRADAFAASRYIIDELKTRAPFWKQEQTPEGRVWVEGNTE